MKHTQLSQVGFYFCFTGSLTKAVALASDTAGVRPAVGPKGA